MPEPREPVLEGLADVYSGSDCITVSHDFSGPDAASICSQALPPIQREPPRAPPEPRPCRCAEEFRRRLTEGYHQENGALGCSGDTTFSLFRDLWLKARRR